MTNYRFTSKTSGDFLDIIFKEAAILPRTFYESINHIKINNNGLYELIMLTYSKSIYINNQGIRRKPIISHKISGHWKPRLDPRYINITRLKQRMADLYRSVDG